MFSIALYEMVLTGCNTIHYWGMITRSRSRCDTRGQERSCHFNHYQQRWRREIHRRENEQEASSTGLWVKETMHRMQIRFNTSSEIRYWKFSNYKLFFSFSTPKTNLISKCISKPSFKASTVFRVAKIHL
jgi:hypothetical protein